MSPVGRIGALGVVGLGRAGVAFCGLGEGGEAAAQGGDRERCRGSAGCRVG